jgi:hypothetical protein
LDDTGEDSRPDFAKSFGITWKKSTKRR